MCHTLVFTGPHCAVSSESNCRSRGYKFHPSAVPYFHGDWSFSSFPWFKKGCSQLQAKVCSRSTGYWLSQAYPGKTVVGWTDSLGGETSNQANKQNWLDFKDYIVLDHLRHGLKVSCCAPLIYVVHLSVICILTTCLTFGILIEFSIHNDTINLPIVYFKGLHVELWCTSVPESCFNLSKQWRPWWNAALCCISSGTSLFAEVPV